MKKQTLILTICTALLQLVGAALFAQPDGNSSAMKEQYRPQIHFSPRSGWMNDPNGMIYSKGVYHLFFQHHPYSSVWGPMHWGHATSSDMVHWKQEPIALYPDSIGTIFSGSAVVDVNNTSGFGRKGAAPLVAIFTQHDPVGAAAGRNDFQHQSIAYSNDNGMTWTKYAGNPVIKNPGITDFRDPKVMWYAPKKKWVMTLATKDDITFYSSPDLKEWKKESEFGKGVGAHGGVWECPDLVAFDDKGKQRWVLLVNMGSGGPNQGSGTQYFLGDFDGSMFVSDQTAPRWLDYGPDDYAGVTWANTGDRKIFLGWMCSPHYAGQVPTEKWRSAMTIPRDLAIGHVGNADFLTSLPVPELSGIQTKPVVVEHVKIDRARSVQQLTGKVVFPCRIDLDIEAVKDLSLVLSNDLGEKVVIGYDKDQNQYFIDRTRSGKVDFNKDFASRDVAPRLANNGKMKITLVIDVSSVELFADGGLTVMTEVFFPNKPFDDIQIESKDGGVVRKLGYTGLKSIWP